MTGPAGTSRYAHWPGCVAPGRAPPTAGGFPAGSTRLTDLQAYCAHVPDITEADIMFGQALHDEVLAEGPWAHRGSVQLLLPVRIVLGRVGEHRLFRSAVVTTVGLFITGDAVLSDPDRGSDGGLVDRTDPRPAGAWFLEALSRADEYRHNLGVGLGVDHGHQRSLRTYGRDHNATVRVTALNQAWCIASTCSALCPFLPRKSRMVAVIG